MEALVDDGLARHIGVSNFSLAQVGGGLLALLLLPPCRAPLLPCSSERRDKPFPPPAQVEELVSWARIQPVCNQVELHPMLAQRKLVDGCQRLVRVGGWAGGWAW